MTRPYHVDNISSLFQRCSLFDVGENYPLHIRVDLQNSKYINLIFGIPKVILKVNFFTKKPKQVLRQLAEDVLGIS